MSVFLNSFDAGRLSLERLQLCTGLRCPASGEFCHASGIRDWEGGYSALLREGQLIGRSPKVNLDDVAQSDLAGRDQIG